MRKGADLDEVLESFHAALTREIVDDLSGIVEFERASGWEPYFRTYYSNYLRGSSRLERTVRASVARRRPLASFCERLRRSHETPLVLDVGCGFGSDSMFLAQLGCEVVGVDPDARKIAIAERRLEYWRSRFGEIRAPRFLVGYLDRAEGIGEQFDAVFTSECLHHCEPVEDTLLRIRDLAGEDGAVFVLESNARNPLVALKREMMTKLDRRLLMVEDSRHRLYGNENIRGPREWARLFRECGFRVTGEHYSRTTFMEAFGWEGLEGVLCVLPGRGLWAIHVAFELAPAPVEPW